MPDGLYMYPHSLSLYSTLHGSVDTSSLTGTFAECGARRMPIVISVIGYTLLGTALLVPCRLSVAAVCAQSDDLHYSVLTRRGATISRAVSLISVASSKGRGEGQV
jgi:hypothetical protein